jgi:hypothetical protein
VATLTFPCPQHRRLFVIGTTSQRGTMVDLGVLQEFDAHATVPCLSLPEHVASVVKEINLFEGSEISRLAQLLRAEQLNFRLGMRVQLGRGPFLYLSSSF